MKSGSLSFPCPGGVAIGSTLLLLSATSTFACLQGSKFHPSKGLSDEVAKILRLPPPPAPDAPPVDRPTATSLQAVAVEALRLPAQPLAEAEERARYASYVRDYEVKPAGTVTADQTTDYAIALVHLGRTADAIKVLVSLEEKTPGTYRTAVNLGTAYELDGQLENAATWIAKGLERNPRGHAGTEWLHAAILRARIGLRGDPTWLRQHQVLESVTDRSAEEIVRAVEYQLTERLHFVKPADAVVCDLFYQAALRVSGPDAEARRTFYLRESLRFGDWRKKEVTALLKS